MIRKTFFVINHLFWNAIDWIYPPRCGGCQELGERWCVDCQKQIIRLESICPCCGDVSANSALCSDCIRFPPPFTQMRTAANFKGSLRQAIHKLKYKHDIGLGESLSHYLIELYDYLGWQVDMITPVPLSQSRKQERGYNQASLLAWPLAMAREITFQPQAVERIRNTAPQVGLSATKRQENVKGAFLARENWVRGKRVLVVDDVTTTGSTIQACCIALKAAGARELFAMTLARSVLEDDSPPESLAEDHVTPVQSLY